MKHAAGPHVGSGPVDRRNRPAGDCYNRPTFTRSPAKPVATPADPPVRHTPRSVLVTGGAGFIGSNFLRYAVPRFADARFVNLDLVTYAGRPANTADLEQSGRYTFVRGDIADADLAMKLFAEHAFTTVVHFAAESHVDRSILDPMAFVRTNVLGTTVLLDAARRAWRHEDGSWGDVRFHHVSTDEVFGALGPEGLFHAGTPYDPRSPYAASKAGSDHLVRAYAHTYGLPVVLSNSSNNYGPFQFPEKLIPLVIRNVLRGEPVPIYGQGLNVRDWLHVEDHCAAIERILTCAGDRATYLVSGGEERTNIDLVRMLIDLVDEALGRPEGSSRALMRFVTDRPGHDFRYALDGSPLESELGWRPSRTLPQGLRETVAWYLAHREWLEEADDDRFRSYYRQQYQGR
jgi:dTDP-glucose 4,6-dehydratase